MIQSSQIANLQRIGIAERPLWAVDNSEISNSERQMPAVTGVILVVSVPIPHRFLEVAVMLKTLPMMMVLGLGFVIGVVFASQSPMSVVAQTPPPLQAPTSKPGPTSGFLPGEMGSSVTVIEAREGRDVAGSGDLIGFSHVDDSGSQVITLVNTQKLWMAVYHVGSAGEIRLASSRAIDADFTLQLNATSPTPDEIRRLNGPPRNRE